MGATENMTPDAMLNAMLTDVQAVGQVDIGTGQRANAVRRTFYVGGVRYEVYLKVVDG